MPTFGQEWQISGDWPDGPGEAVRVIESFIGREFSGATITKIDMIGYRDDEHRRLRCRSKRSHTHIYVKWRTPDEPEAPRHPDEAVPA